MSTEAQDVYNLMLERFRETKERHISIKVPFAIREKRRAICDELASNDLITNIEIYGPDSIACDLIDESLAIVKTTY